MYRYSNNTTHFLVFSELYMDKAFLYKPLLGNTLRVVELLAWKVYFLNGPLISASANLVDFYDLFRNEC